MNTVISSTVIAHFDCSAGISGDMILAAFLDAGLPLDYLRSELAKMDLHDYDLVHASTIKQGLAAGRFDVVLTGGAGHGHDHDQSHDHHHGHGAHGCLHRSWSDIRRLIENSDLVNSTKQRAVRVFQRLAEVEGRMHGRSPDEVHFHEVGAVDSIIDIVGAAIAWDFFHIDYAVASPLPLGSGWIETAHGRLPLPAPATLALLEGAPTYGSGLEVELVTPTGAAFLTALVDEFGLRPAMTIRKVGHGAGRRDLPDRPNILRVTIGETLQAVQDRFVVTETNIDDMNPEIYPYIIDRLLAEGASDAWLTPIQMKKGRPAVTLSFLSPAARVDDLTTLVLTETSTIGLRQYDVRRRILPRESVTVETPWGQARLKKVMRPDRIDLVPEYESCREIARKTGCSLLDIYCKIISLQETF
jgi:pyridinium-3,5-bisthiocarboxylic acid mononucleotide nickel chelatase